MAQILRLPNHDHYWIKAGILYEAYKPHDEIVSYMIMKVPDVPDNDHCTPEELEDLFLRYL